MQSKKTLLTILTVLSSFAVSVSFFSCKKNKEPKIYPLLQTTKDWMFFDVGTWWVYKNVNNGIEDSVFVTESSITSIDFSEAGKNIIKKSGLVNLNSNYQFILSGTGGGNGICKSNTLSNEGGQTYLYDPPNALGSSTVTSKVINFMPSYTFGGKTDTLVIRKDNKDWSEGGDTMEYHIFKGIGIIRKINHTKNEDWQLQRFNIKMNPN